MLHYCTSVCSFGLDWQYVELDRINGLALNRSDGNTLFETKTTWIVAYRIHRRVQCVNSLWLVDPYMCMRQWTVSSLVPIMVCHKLVTSHYWSQRSNRQPIECHAEMMCSSTKILLSKLCQVFYQGNPVTNFNFCLFVTWHVFVTIIKYIICYRYVTDCYNHVVYPQQSKEVSKIPHNTVTAIPLYTSNGVIIHYIIDAVVTIVDCWDIAGLFRMIIMDSS